MHGRLSFGRTTSEADTIYFKPSPSECSTHDVPLSFGNVASECSILTPRPFGKATSDFSTLGPAFTRAISSNLSTLGPVFNRVVSSDLSTVAPQPFGRAISDFSVHDQAFQKVTSDSTAFTPQKVVTRFSCADTIDDSEFDLVQDGDDGFDEIMNDEDFINQLAGGKNLSYEFTAEKEEEHVVGRKEARKQQQQSGKNMFNNHQQYSGTKEDPQAPNPYNQENLWQRNAVGGKAAGKRGFIFDPALPSVGTALHFYSGCIPCDFLATEEGCTMGKYCGFCHFCPPMHGEYMKAKRRASGIAFEQQLRESRHILNQLQAAAREKNVTNVGSNTHFTGACSPCIFIHRVEGCKDAEECIHCHLCDSSMYRMKKATRSEVGKRIKTIMRNKRTT